MSSDSRPNRHIAHEVKYSLRQLLVEVEEERSLSHFARETVDQEEIGKLFRKKRARRKKRDSGE